MARPQPNPNLVLALVSLPIFIGALDLTIVSAVLPAVISDLQMPVEKGLDIAKWVVSGYLLSYAVSMTFMGRVSDLWGRRTIYLISLAFFFVGSWLVAISSSGAFPNIFFTINRMMFGGRPDQGLMGLYALIFGRVVQAFGAGAMVPVSMALVADLYPPEKRALPLGVVGAVDTAGWVLGHLYGGILVGSWGWSWQTLFWINLPITAFMFAITWWFLRGLRHDPATGGVDWIGVALIGIALVGLNLALGSNEPAPGSKVETSELTPFTISMLITAVVFFVAFIWSQRKIKHPLLNLGIFSGRNLSSASGINLLVGFCLMIGLVSVPLFINAVGINAVENGTNEEAALISGYLLSAFTVPMAIAAIPGGYIADKWGYRWSVLFGLGTALVGFFLMSLWEIDMAKYSIEFFRGLKPGSGGFSHAAFASTMHMIIGLLIAGVGLGLTIAPIGTAVINGVGDFERGMASALVIILRLIGMSVSVSLMTTYGLHRKTTMSRAMLTEEMAADLEATARVALDVITHINHEMSLIAVGVCVAAIIPAFFLHHKDQPQP